LIFLGEQCQLSPLPYGLYGVAAIVMEGTPVFCGGENNQYTGMLKCFKLEKSTKTWVQVSAKNLFFFFFFVGLWSQSADKLTIHSIPCSWIL
jgi:hypothetical protein